MATNANYILLEKITVGAAGASSVTFNSIPQTGYTDLVVKISARTNRALAVDGINISFNGSTSSFTGRYLEGDGSAASSATSTQFAGDAVSATATTNTFGNTEIYIPNYVSSNNKSFSSDAVTENNATNSAMDLIAGLWSNTAAITSIGLSPLVGTLFNQYSTFYLYGVAGVGATPAKAPFATGGDIIETDGTYWYHAFCTSGTFTPAKALAADILVVAGGGAGGGSYSGGGGGAGGLLGFTAQALTSGTPYTCTVGAGGAGVSVSYNGAKGGNGSNSQFGALTAAVGGGGGGASGNTANGVGSGGSGGGSASGSQTPGTGTSGQGNSGGASTGGGGGAGAVGATGSTPVIGAGGIGATYNTTVGGSAGPYAFIDAMGAATNTGQLSSSHYYYAGGGGYGDISAGANGALGGGGNGGNAIGSLGTAGTVNTGGGGGGGQSSSGTAGTGAGAAGGSGIVIVRYLA
jgi:hypothetical protein